MYTARLSNKNILLNVYASMHFNHLRNLKIKNDNILERR